MLIKDQHCLESILEAIDRIIEYTSGVKSADDFNNDYRNFDATMMNFVVIGEMIDKISDEFKKKHPEIEWVKIKGFRNIVAHNYWCDAQGNTSHELPATSYQLFQPFVEPVKGLLLHWSIELVFAGIV